MTLHQAINEYRKLKISEATAMAMNANTDSIKNATISLFQKVNGNLMAMMNENTIDPFTACLLFSEMSMRKIGDLTPFLAYYFGTKAQSQSSIPEHSKLDARRMRVFALVQNMDKFDRMVMLAQTPMIGYSGTLNDQEFFDFLIMADVYRVWDSDNTSSFLQSLKRQTQENSLKYPMHSKETIIREGEKAHQALFKAIEMACGPR